MQCPQCHAENREGSRFCAECGASLTSACPDCGFFNYPGAKFCSGCGKALMAVVPATDQPLADTVPLPQDASKREVAEAERRQLTVMFCDLVGSTALAERLDPEELRELLAQYQDTCAEVIDRYGGHIARYVGDGLLVCFGYPQAHEDDAQRGVRAGLGIVDAIRDLETKMANPNVNLAVRIGITTGLVVVGDIGSGERVEEKAIVGETPNVAARLQALAEPNTVIIGAGTHPLVEGLFDCDDVGPQKLKGISQPITAYRVRTESTAPSRFEAKAARGLTPLVGREEEIGLLLKRWSEAKDGQSQVVLLSGEAGIGKSRIVRGFEEFLESELRNRVLYYGSPYHQNSAFYPAIDQLQRGLRFEKGDTPMQKLDKLDAVLGDLGLPVAEYGPVLARLLTVSLDDRYPELEMDPERLKKKILETVVLVIQAIASQHPVVMVIEDMHWIDPSTQELITLLIEQLRSARFLLVITFRPEFESPWGGHTHIRSLTLNRLSRKESAAMIAKVTRGKALPAEVIDQIIDKTDGVPLFVEELTKNILEAGLLKDTGERYVLSGSLRSFAIPASLRDSLMARIDRLGSVKEVAQLAATVGRTFNHELLAAASPLEEGQLHKALEELIRAELLYRRGLPPDVTYEFKHALVQDVAYQSLLKSTRQHYHQQIAHVLEEQFPEIAEIQPELLAHHYTEAGQAAEAIDYWLQAGSRAAEHSANVEAVGHLRKGLQLVADLANKRKGQRRELEFLIALGAPLIATKGPGDPEVEGVYRRAVELCDRLPSSENHFKAQWGWWRVSMNCHIARERADKLLELARDLKDSGLLLQAHHCQWATTFELGDQRACCAHVEAGLKLYDEEQHRGHASIYGGHDARVCGYGEHGLSLWFCGYPDQAVGRVNEAIGWAHKLSHIGSLAHAKYYDMLLNVYRRDASAVSDRTEELIEFATKEGLPEYLASGQFCRGWASAQLGRVEHGLDDMREGIASLKLTGTREDFPTFFDMLAQVCQTLGQVEEAIDYVEAALAESEEVGIVWLAELHRRKGELLLRVRRATEREAESHLQAALETAQGQNAKSLELRAAMSLSRLRQSQGKPSEARHLLTPIYHWFTEGFDTPDLKEAKALLDELV